MNDDRIFSQTLDSLGPDQPQASEATSTSGVAPPSTEVGPTSPLGDVEVPSQEMPLQEQSSETAPQITQGTSFEDALVSRLIKEEEFKGTAYRATEGETYLTLGYGHYGSDVKEGQTITEEKALELLRQDINERLPAVRKAIPNFDNLSQNLKVEIAQSWFRWGMSGSPETIKLINSGKFKEAATEFLDNEEYRTARKRGRAGIIPRMEGVADALRSE